MREPADTTTEVERRPTPQRSTREPAQVVHKTLNLADAGGEERFGVPAPSLLDWIAQDGPERVHASLGVPSRLEIVHVHQRA